MVSTRRSPGAPAAPCDFPEGVRSVFQPILALVPLFSTGTPYSQGFSAGFLEFEGCPRVRRTRLVLGPPCILTTGDVPAHSEVGTGAPAFCDLVKPSLFVIPVQGSPCPHLPDFSYDGPPKPPPLSTDLSETLFCSFWHQFLRLVNCFNLPDLLCLFKDTMVYGYHLFLLFSLD